MLYTHHAVRDAAAEDRDGRPGPSATPGGPGPFGATHRATANYRSVPRNGESVTAEELIAFCKERVAAYKYPREIEFVEVLPKTASGKILRQQLRDEEAGRAKE